MQLTGIDIGSWAEIVASLAALGALGAAIVAVRWAKRAAEYTEQQVLETRHEILEVRNANSLPVLVQQFSEHRGSRLAAAREFVDHQLPARETPAGLADLKNDEERALVMELAWFYDNLGALVAHGIVEIDPIAGYLGGAAITSWSILLPKIIVPERARSAQSPDSNRWQAYLACR